MCQPVMPDFQPEGDKYNPGGMSAERAAKFMWGAVDAAGNSNEGKSREQINKEGLQYAKEKAQYAAENPKMTSEYLSTLSNKERAQMNKTAGTRRTAVASGNSATTLGSKQRSVRTAPKTASRRSQRLPAITGVRMPGSSGGGAGSASGINVPG
jgi:hypothetical protein